MTKTNRIYQHTARITSAMIAAMLAVSVHSNPTFAQGVGGEAAPGATSAAPAAPGASNAPAAAGAAGQANAPGANTAPSSPEATGAPTSPTAPSGESGTGATSPSNPSAESTPSAASQSPAQSTSGISGAPPTLGVPAAGASTQVGTVSHHYDMARTVREALVASADLSEALKNVQIDREKSDEAKAAGRPNVSGTGQATRFDSPTFVSLAGSPPIEVEYNHTELLALNLSDQLDLTGEIAAAADQEHLQSLEDRLVAQQIADQRILNAHTVYYNLLRAQHQVDVAQSSLATAQAQQQLALELNRQQVGEKIDVLTANTQVATAQQQLTAARNNLGLARQNFNNLVGQPVDTPVTVDDIPGVTVGETITSAPTVGAPSPNITLFTVPQSDLQTTDLNKAIDDAYARRPEVLAAQLDLRVQQTGIKIARSGLEPTLTLSAAGDYYPTTSFEAPRQRIASVTATLNVPFYDGGATRDKVNEAKLRTQNAETTLGSRKSDVALDVGQAYLNLETSESQIASANSALQQAIAARQLAEIRYQGQVGLYLEVTDAQSALVAAEDNQVNAVYDYFVAKAEYQNAIGAPDVPAGAIYPATPTRR